MSIEIEFYFFLFRISNFLLPFGVVCVIKIMLEIRNLRLGNFNIEGFFADLSVPGDIGRRSRRESPRPAGIAIGIRPLREGARLLLRFRRGAGFAA